MLIKKELEQITVQQCPKMPTTDKKYSLYIAAVQVINIAKSGNILVIDVFERVSSTLRMRFFSDGVNFLVCLEWPAKNWLQQIPGDLLRYQYQLSPSDIDASKEDIKLAHEILKNRQNQWHYVHGIKDEMDSFVRGINQEKQEKAMDRKYALMDDHFRMFPAYPDDLADFCETEIFGFTYIFLSKICAGEREATCGHCRHKFKVPKTDRPGGEGTCPACGMHGKYRGQWSNGTYKDKAKICITHKNGNQLLIRWTNVTRLFISMEKKYEFDDYYRNLYLNTHKGPIIYAYDYKPQIGMGYCWFRQKNGAVHYGKSFIYTNNLEEVFGKSYYHVNLQAGLKGSGKLSLASLLDNLKNIPAAEYLFKLGLSALAADLSIGDIGKATGFFEALGISKQYLPLYKKFNITPLEHRIIRASKTWVNEASFSKLRLLAPEYRDIEDVVNFLKTMSFERLVNYFSRQNAMSGWSFRYLMTLYKDYISMSETLKVDMSRKSVRFPSDIKAAHDLILERFNKVKHRREDREFKKAMKKLYAGMKEYASEDYCIVFPHLRSDFIKEGQSLKHCVGADRYYKNHMTGKYMIFFIRRSSEPKKPYFTLEIDMENLKILQFYGFSNSSAPPEIKKFANEFLKKLKPTKEENRVRVMVPA